MKKKVLLVLGALALVLTGCGKGNIPKLENGKEVVASIDGFNLTADDLYEQLKKQNGINMVISKIDEAIINKEITDSKEAEDYADGQVDALRLQYQQYYGVELEEVLPQYDYADVDELKQDIMNDYNKNLVLNNYLEGVVTEDEINEYYENEIFGEMTVRHILIEPDVTDDMTTEEKTAAEEAAKKEAEELIVKLNEGANFEDLAKENSDDAGTASQGGLFADFTKEGTDEAFFNASLALEDGKYTTTPVKSSFGYYIILKVSQKEKPKLEDVIDTVKEKIVENKLEEDTNLSVIAWDEIRAKHNIKINDSVLKENYDKVINQYKNAD